uniref:Uncharacterized protein n=1 Tax=Prolemur simus TaxID=1328070 RepID=A0A8C9DU73_PROSS
LLLRLAGAELLTLSDPPASASQRARITGMSHRAQPILFCSMYKSLLFQSCKYFLLYSFRSFIVMAFTCRPMIYLELICMYRARVKIYSHASLNDMGSVLRNVSLGDFVNM